VKGGPALLAQQPPVDHAVEGFGQGFVFDRVDQFEDWDPRQHYQLTLRADELTDIERNAAASADDIELPI